MSDFTDALERELERLEDELQNDPRYRRIDQIRSLLAEYQNGANLSQTAAAVAVAASASAIGTRTLATPLPVNRRPRVRLSKAASIRLAVQEFLLENGTSHRSLILKSLTDQHILGREKNPMAALAAYLSDMKEYFEPDGRGNFSLKKRMEGLPGPKTVSH